MSTAHHRDADYEGTGSASPSIVPLSQTERDAVLLDEMVQRMRTIRPPSGAEALRALRDAFPGSPLTLRVAALNATMQVRRT
jgi:hypothetical protein